MTPKELKLTIEAFGDKQQQKNDDLISLAWSINALHRYEKLPELETLLSKKKKEPRKAQTEAEMLTAMRIITAINSGNVVNK